MAKKKSVAVHIPLQMGFGFDVLNSQGQRPPFLYELDDVYEALDHIQQAQWVSTDTEGTGLVEASVPVTLSNTELKQGSSNAVRMRTIQARVPTINGRRGPRLNFVFDCDKMGPKLTAEVANVILSRKLFIAHNAGFDLYWLRRAGGRTVMPALVADTMLLTRLLQPKLVLKRTELISDIKHISEVPQADVYTQAAWKSLISGASGSSLADVVLALYGVIVDKTYQMPNNWTGLLGFEHYTYAVDDAIWADRIMSNLLNIPEDGDLLQAYMDARSRQSTIRLVEPQVPELVMLREHGMPLNADVGRRYVVKKRKELARTVDELILLEPTLLERHRVALADPDAGLDDALKGDLAKAFESRGISLRRTAATGAPQVGEKDLRACRAVQVEQARPLFNAWVAVCRSKKTSAMALDVVGYSNRSDDGKIRALLSHGPVTGRLSSSEPNGQQWPRDQLFRAMCMSPVKPNCDTIQLEVTPANRYLLEEALGFAVTLGTVVTVDTGWLMALYYTDKLNITVTADNIDILTKCKDGKKLTPGAEISTEFSTYLGALGEPGYKKQLGALLEGCFTHMIVASDFGALDVRVGAALCIRSQREMLALARGYAVPGEVQPPDDIVQVIKNVVKHLESKNPIGALEAQALRYEKHVCRLEEKLEKLKDDLDKDKIQRNTYFKRRQEVRSELLSIKLGWRLAQCLAIGAKRGENEYSALRDAFVADIDIHTFTGMKLAGRDPMKEFEGLSVGDRKNLEKKLKKELGPRRQQGKIANLSLLYGMADAGFQEAAARGYNEHWTMQEAHDIRALWMNAYPEVELWHLWTECLQAGVVYLPEQGREKPVRTGWWLAKTLADREIVAYGLNAALSYQDQSTGADILGMIMHRLAMDYPDIFKCSINQVHDEVVFCYPTEAHAEYLPIIEDVMVGEANSLLMPYGVPAAVSPACGCIWIKD